MAALVDTNVLIYRFDPRFPEKQAAADQLFLEGVANSSIRVSYQTLVEFVSVATRRQRLPPLLTPEVVWREVEEMLFVFDVLYPNEAVLRTAVRGAATFRLGWFDALTWAYAEHYGLELIYSEDFEHGRLYGTVRAVNPFLDAGHREKPQSR